MNALLGLFSGPYAFAARMACYAALVLSIAAGGAYAMHHWDAGEIAEQKLETAKVQADFDKFKADTAKAGEVAKQRSLDKEAADKQAKEQADENHKNALAGLTAELERLRRDSAAGRTVPPAPADSRNPQLACFDRALLGDAVDGFVGDVSRQVAKGAAATLELDNARAWAKNIGAPPASASGGSP